MSRPAAARVAELDLVALGFPNAPKDDLTTQLVKSLYFRCAELVEAVGSPDGRELYSASGYLCSISLADERCDLVVDYGENADGSTIAQRFLLTTEGQLYSCVSRMYPTEDGSVVVELQPLFVDSVFLHERLKHEFVFSLIQPLSASDDQMDIRLPDERAGWHRDAETTLVVL
jgi:hypothetical protein